MTLFDVDQDARAAELRAVTSLAERGALFALNDSGGKDSQAMRIRVMAWLRALGRASQAIVVHAALGEVEWHGALEHARQGAERDALPFIAARAPKTFLGMVERRFATRPEVPSWPSAGQRQCTSDLKRGPLDREIRRWAKANGYDVVVNCMGIRAEESARRSKAVPFARNDAKSIPAREWHDWLPIHRLPLAEVWNTIHFAGELPHPAYEAGNERLSCVFCILGSARDARNGAVHRPDLFERYVQLERTTGYTMHQSRVPLEAFAGITVAEAREAHRHLPVIEVSRRAA
jgi:3'-phosphoadenosine 5'-phosphosulfate sulfotransferase (PAPS reductase)/FAD synthetase